MPDILKVTTPIVNRNEIVLPKQGTDAINAFSITDQLKVLKTHNQSEILKHNTSNQQNSDTPTVLLNMLKDPAVAVTYLKNIFLLEELYKLLPANNKTVTNEIEQIFKDLIIDESNIKKELMSQEKSFSLFKGELFDFLRNISDKYKESPNVQIQIANLLKSINNIANRKDILDSIQNSLLFLKENVGAISSFSQRIDAILANLQSEGKYASVSSLKEEVLALVKDIENSLLFTQKVSKVVSIMVYNLSRYNENNSYFNESVYRLRQMIGADEQKELAQLITTFSKQLNSGAFLSGLNEKGIENSKVMDALIKLVFNQSNSEIYSPAESARIDSILHSLLSSPCNFTPLLHFVLPVMFESSRAFAEIWINPESDEKDMPEGAGPGKHFLLVIDIDSMGRFEAEIFVHKDIVDFYLFCPSGYEEKFQNLMYDVSKDLIGINYKLGTTRLEPLERSRSLMEVFKSLPYKRMGVNVRI